MPKSRQTNHISQYGALSSNVKLSNNNNEKFYAIWKIPDVIQDDRKTMKIEHNDDSQHICILYFNSAFKNATLYYQRLLRKKINRYVL